jgi:predicted RNA-binding Zn ribbon-like protein
MVDQGRALADLRGRAEIHARRGELDLAHADLDAIRELRGFVPNAIDDAEDLRVVALVRAAEGDLEAADRALREVIQRAEIHRQPQLKAEASRDLAVLLRQVPIDLSNSSLARRIA